MKKVLIIKAHPREDSFCNSLVDRYIAGAKTNQVELKIISLKDLQLEPWLKYGWSQDHDSEPIFSEDLRQAQAMIKWSNHMVFAYPTYWAMPPAMLALFIEAMITSGFAFKYHDPWFGIIPRWDKLLKGHTASIISTMDAPPLFMKLHDSDPGGKMMRDVLRFTGAKLKKKYYFGSVIMSGEQHRRKWLERAYKIGQKESRQL